MTTVELLKSAQYLVDNKGQKTAVLLDLAVWEELVNIIKEMEAKDRQHLLNTVAEARQAYQTGQVKRGTADDLIADLNT